MSDGSRRGGRRAGATEEEGEGDAGTEGAPPRSARVPRPRGARLPFGHGPRAPRDPRGEAVNRPAPLRPVVGSSRTADPVGGGDVPLRPSVGQALGRRRRPGAEACGRA